MTERQHIVICDQDCIVGDMLIYVLKKSNCRVTRLNGSALKLVGQLIKQKADILIANSGSDVASQLHMLRCCRTKYPEQKQILITAVFANLDEMLKGEKIEAVLFKPFKLSQLNETIEHLLSREKATVGNCWQKLWISLKQLLSDVLNFSKYRYVFKQTAVGVRQLWRCWLLKNIEDERLKVFQSAYKFCQSKFASYKHILELWLYLEFLERRYLLAKCGADIERNALQFCYATLKGTLERGLSGWAVSLKGGDGLGPELDSALFTKFFHRLRNKELSFSCFMQAAQARLVRWALSRPSSDNIYKMIQKNAAQLRKTSHSQSLSDKVRTAETKAEIAILASASVNEYSLQEVFRQAWG